MLASIYFGRIIEVNVAVGTYAVGHKNEYKQLRNRKPIFFTRIINMFDVITKFTNIRINQTINITRNVKRTLCIASGIFMFYYLFIGTFVQTTTIRRMNAKMYVFVLL